MKIWNLFKKATGIIKTPRIKKVIAYNDLTIKLYELDWTRTEKVGNIEAYDSAGNLRWVVEKPTYGFHYWDMQINEDDSTLDADSGWGEHYKISVEDGHIISSKLIK